MFNATQQGGIMNKFFKISSAEHVKRKKNRERERERERETSHGTDSGETYAYNCQ